MSSNDKDVKLKKRTRTKFRAKIPGCPRTKNHTNWCYALCIPKDGLGECGRVAHHAVLGRTQKAILKYRAAKDNVGP